MSEGAAYCYECGGNLAPVKNSDARSCWNCGWITSPAINRQIDALHATIQTLHGMVAPLAIRVNELDALEAQVGTLNRGLQMALTHIQTLEAQMKALLSEHDWLNPQPVTLTAEEEKDLTVDPTVVCNGATTTLGEILRESNASHHDRLLQRLWTSWTPFAMEAAAHLPAVGPETFDGLREERNTNPAPALMILQEKAAERVASQSWDEYAKSITNDAQQGTWRTPFVAKDPAGPEPTFVTGTALRCPVHGLSVSPGSQPFNSVDDPSGKCYSCGSTLEVV